ncbi:MAG TPA: hypothetical protein VIK60_08030 [Vicinamibacterales bacterium]
MAAIHRTIRQRLLIPVINGTVLAVVFGLVSLLATAGGHGTYVPAALFFPGALLLAIGLNVISNSVLYVAAAQWPLYGATVGFAAGRGHKKEAIIWLTVVHALLLAACFLFDRRGQFL